MKEELEQWKTKDPVTRAEKLLLDLGILTTEKREALVEQINSEIDVAVNEAETAKYSEPDEAYNDVYSEDFPVKREEL